MATTDTRLLADRFPRSTGYHPDWVLASVHYVVRAGLPELNPVLRHALQWHPVGFGIIKVAFSLAALLLVVRLQLWRVGRVVLWLNVLAYVLLDGYWVVLLLTAR